MGDSFNPNTYDDTFIADLVAFVAADEFQSNRHLHPTHTLRTNPATLTHES